MAKSPVTCHILDSSLGKPAPNVGVFLERYDVSEQHYSFVAKGETDADGRCNDMLPPTPRLSAGLYKLTFQTGEYFIATKRDAFYPMVEVSFHIAKPEEHYHIPLLLSPWSYTTYRGT